MKSIMALLFATTLSGCASNSDLENMQQSIQKRLDEIESHLNNQKLVELYRMVEETKEQVVRIQGDMETVQHDLVNTKKRQDDLYSDLDTRISSENGELAKQYEESIELIKKRDFNKALTILKKITQHPQQKKQAPETFFWIGISYTGLSNFNSAIDSYRKFVEENPNHDRTPDALLNMANCQHFIREGAGEKATIAKLLKLYPNSNAAKQARSTLK